MTDTTDQHSGPHDFEVKPDDARQVKAIKPGKRYLWLCCSICGSLALHLLVGYIFIISFSLSPLLVITSEPVAFWLPPLFFTGVSLDHAAITPPVSSLSEQNDTPDSSGPTPELPDEIKPLPVSQEVMKASPVVAQTLEQPVALFVSPPKPKKQEEKQEEKQPAKEAVKLVEKKSDMPPLKEPQQEAKVESPAVQPPITSREVQVENEEGKPSKQADADLIDTVKSKKEPVAEKTRLERAKKTQRQGAAKAVKDEKVRQAEEKVRLNQRANEEIEAQKEKEREAEVRARQEAPAREEVAAREKMERDVEEKGRQDKLAEEVKAAREEKKRQADEKARLKQLADEAQAAKEAARREKLASEAKAAKEEKKRQADEKARLKKLAAEELAAKEAARREKLASEAKAAREEKKRQADEKARLKQLADEAQAAKEAARREKLASEAKAAREEKKRLAEEKAEQERVAAVKGAIEREKKELEKRAAEKERREQLEKDEQAKSYLMKRLAKLKAERELAAATKEVQEAEKAAKASSQRQGLAIPSVRGDVKLLAVGEAPRRVAIHFREFKVNRRTRPFSRTELKQDEQITPISVSPGEHKFEYIIEKAREGVYSLEIDLPSLKPTAFSLLLYEGTGRFARKELPRHAPGRNRMLVRILMPEGILWDDEAAFSGSMEDSESVTRFNSDSGLVWKELKSEE